MDRHVNAISGRLSLRPPQRESLKILARITEITPPSKDIDLAGALSTIQSEYPTVSDFERDFPSLCFALATGVGKTRLMGAFISYLHISKHIRHFFVLAPNLTIYNKLITDFTPNTPKYVFQGISEFATNPPLIITGDNYESGLGVREEARRQMGLPMFEDEIHINIFNISKINSEVRGGRSPRIKRLSEYIGESYFDYLSGLDDLVLLMDESHRYRASAGVRAINELRPILGLELTATPQVVSGSTSTPFKNVIYSYPLSRALSDGFVKEPAVATRENFDASSLSEGQLERLKLEDGVRVHESTKVELEVYARQHNQPIVKPFMLVIAADTTHASALVQQIKDDSFFDGRYRDRVIEVHSKRSGDEADETVQRLLAVENPNEPTEIVVHVNMLKEGWDVTNLYTIVPLRTANSRVLIEQSIGRGLRLPYGRRVGVAAVDRLTIVAHDRFQEIIDEANREDSVIKSGVVIGRDIPINRQKTVIVKPVVALGVTQFPTNGSGSPREAPVKPEQERAVTDAILKAIRRREHFPRSGDLTSEKVTREIVEEVEIELMPGQYVLPGTETSLDLQQIVESTVEYYVSKTIDIPRIVVVPTGEVTSGFRTFQLDLSSVRYQPVEEDILIQHLSDHERYRIATILAGGEEARLEDYLVRVLIDKDDIAYDELADLLYDLTSQVVDHLRSYLHDDDKVRNVLLYHQRQLGNLIHIQMQSHRWDRATSYAVEVTKGFTTPSENAYQAPADESVRDLRVPVDDRSRIRQMLFEGFKKCIYPIQKFDTDSERRFAILLEDDPSVLKWYKPTRTDFRIYYNEDTAYIPDFVVETVDTKYICEPKRATQVNDSDVVAKEQAAREWCSHATTHELAYGGKPWKYVLIPHDAISANMTLNGLAEATARIS